MIKLSTYISEEEKEFHISFACKNIILQILTTSTTE